MAERPKRIVILGGGFGGLSAARELERILPRNANVDVTLVNRENFFLFTPMLHEVAVSDLDLATIVSPLRRLLERTRLFIGNVEDIDVDAQIVTVAHAGGVHRHELPYDHLVVALGAVTNFYGIPGLAERASTMKWLGDAIELRNQLIAQPQEADFECNGESGRFAYTANAGSATVTGFAIDAQGNLTRLTDSGLSGDLGAGSQPPRSRHEPERQLPLRVQEWHRHDRRVRGRGRRQPNADAGYARAGRSRWLRASLPIESWRAGMTDERAITGLGRKQRIGLIAP